MGPLPTALQSGVQDRRDVRNEANNANGPIQPEVQALSKDRYQNATSWSRS